MKIRARERMMDFVSVTLEDRTRNFDLMGFDQRGAVIMSICADLEIDGYLDYWKQIPMGEKSSMVMKLWKKYGRR